MTTTSDRFSTLRSIEFFEGMHYAQTIAEHGVEVMSDYSKSLLAVLQRGSSADLTAVVDVYEEPLTEMDIDDLYAMVVGVIAVNADGSVATQAMIVVPITEFQIFNHLDVPSELEELAENLLVHEVSDRRLDVMVTRDADGTFDMSVRSRDGETWSRRGVVPDPFAIACAVASYADR